MAGFIGRLREQVMGRINAKHGSSVDVFLLGYIEGALPMIGIDVTTEVCSRLGTLMSGWGLRNAYNPYHHLSRVPTLQSGDMFDFGTDVFLKSNPDVVGTVIRCDGKAVTVVWDKADYPEFAYVPSDNISRCVEKPKGSDNDVTGMVRDLLTKVNSIALSLLAIECTAASMASPETIEFLVNAEGMEILVHHMWMDHVVDLMRRHKIKFLARGCQTDGRYGFQCYRS